eukprot:gb/GEZN01020916.1/.p1 GENE.gb/GEZN01020916.1/~~gb/GEZN01020916.1/.p1  ORF type:complete len:120 (+),score=17.39 gb/GEZN01020916.1/:188-547(+)
MPHHLVLKKIRPLEFVVREYSPGPQPYISSIQLSGRHMHAQPAIVRYQNGSVECLFFEGSGKIVDAVEMATGESGKSISAGKVPEEFYRVPVPHIRRCEDNIARLEKLKEKKQAISYFK